MRITGSQSSQTYLMMVPSRATCEDFSSKPRCSRKLQYYCPVTSRPQFSMNSASLQREAATRIDAERERLPNWSLLSQPFFACTTGACSFCLELLFAARSSLALSFLRRTLLACLLSWMLWIITPGSHSSTAGRPKLVLCLRARAPWISQSRPLILWRPTRNGRQRGETPHLLTGLPLLGQ